MIKHVFTIAWRHRQRINVVNFSYRKNKIHCNVPRLAYLQSPPFISNENIVRLIKTYYPVTNITPHVVKNLGGYEDNNCYVKGSTGNGCTKEFVFKVMVETDPDYFDAMTKLMLHLNKEGISVPQPVAPINNNTEFIVPLKKSHIVNREVENDINYTGLLLTYLPGNILPNLRHSPKLLYNIGAFVGKLNSVLQKFSHPYYEARHFSRDLKNFLALEAYMKYADVPSERKHFEYAFKVYSDYVKPNLPYFQRGIIHNDLNEGNFVCINEQNNQFLMGLIDFCDAVSSYTVFEGAIFITYMMILGGANMIEYAEPAVAGYLNTRHLNEEEFDCLYYLVVCHLTQSTLHALRSSVEFPDNLYRTKTLSESRNTLDMLLKIPKEEINRRWRIAQQKAAIEFKS